MKPLDREPEILKNDFKKKDDMFKISKNRCKTYSVSALEYSIRFFEHLLYPLKCLKCGIYLNAETTAPNTIEACFCEQCMAKGLVFIEPPFCTKCGVKFHKSFDENHICEPCIKTPLKLGKVRAVVEYKGIIKDAIPLFKYQSKLSVAKTFELLLFQAFLKNYAASGIELIMPVPLHKNKLQQRGFNQAFLLIRNFIKLYRLNYEQRPLWEIDIKALSRIKKTKPQTGFDIEHRKENLKNAFKVVNKNTIKNKRILLIDDVLTTGATCNEAGKELLKYGARSVDALVLART